MQLVSVARSVFSRLKELTVSPVQSSRPHPPVRRVLCFPVTKITEATQLNSRSPHGHVSSRSSSSVKEAGVL
jgi:hypothetical protein